MVPIFICKAIQAPKIIRILVFRKIAIFYHRYMQEYTSLGTAGGIYHFRDQIRSGNPSAFFVLVFIFILAD
jgi:hypothetical protein